MPVKYRTEKDSLGDVRVPEEKLWGAQTQRSLENFKIGNEKMPPEIIRALATIKKACAKANFNLGKLSEEFANAIIFATDNILKNHIEDSFPLAVWQTGSGTHSNMNVNEVIARLCLINDISGVHPNDHVNMSQSSNDTFPSAMKIASLTEIETQLLPAIKALINSLKMLESQNKHHIKTGRTHLQDAVPISFGQEISGWRALIQNPYNMIKDNLDLLREIALGATAVGTGINAPKNFDITVCEILSETLSTKIIPEQNKFHALTSLDAFVTMHGALKALACNLMKISNDIRWLASGPRCGLGEITIPQNEPGSSIMPGKVNPTQCEAIIMIAVQVIANDTAIGLAASQGNFELNVFLPVCIYNFLQSVKLLTDGIISFEKNCVRGIKAIPEAMRKNIEKSLMNVTALNKALGYDVAAKIAKTAFKENITIKEACIKLGVLYSNEANNLLNPKNMI